MRLAILDRERESRRLAAAVDGKEGSFVCLYGRRRCGKTRLLTELARGLQAAYYAGDDREESLQRRDFAEAVAQVLPGFDEVDYPDWDPLLRRWWSDAPDGAALIIDEFPSLVAAAPQFPSLLQKKIDAFAERRVHTIICGSSQRMMQGLVLDANAPLYGRAKEIVDLRPLGAYWLRKAFPRLDAAGALEAFSVWGGIPRYWELALEFRTLQEAVRNLAFDPMGVLHREPERLLLDDMRDVRQALSLLALIGRGCHRLSEIAGRLGKPATSLSRPLSRLLGLGLVARRIPFGASPRDSKRTLYVISDPFLRFWFRCVEPNRSRLEAGQMDSVERRTRPVLAALTAQTWEDLARAAVPLLRIRGRQWGPAGRWWGCGTDGKPLEVDILALSDDEKALLVGEVKLTLGRRDRRRAEEALLQKAGRIPLAKGRRVVPCLFPANASRPEKGRRSAIVSVEEALNVLR